MAEVFGSVGGEVGVAVSGEDTSTDGGFGVLGTSNYGVGVSGRTGPKGPGEYGQYGVQGLDMSARDGYGVWAQSWNGTGVYANNFSGKGTSLLVDGKADVTGSLSKAGGSFKIDHPLDPAGKYLHHSFVESPDMKNIYDGTVTLDEGGQAVVELPGWFEALNSDCRYQLTALDQPAPNLHVAAPVSGGQFSIAGGNSGQQVSWQVTGIRQDAWANANRIPVEVDKPAEDQGRYLHPELFDSSELITALAKARTTPAPPQPPKPVE